jgi:hypothetical protein
MNSQKLNFRFTEFYEVRMCSVFESLLPASNALATARYATKGKRSRLHRARTVDACASRHSGARQPTALRQRTRSQWKL